MRFTILKKEKPVLTKDEILPPPPAIKNKL